MKPETKWKTFQDKLVAAFHSDHTQNEDIKNFQPGSHLLQKVMDKEKLNCIVINLYPGNEGYSLMLKTKSGICTETIRMPYEEDEILNYVDNEELPPLLIDILEKSQANVFYGGCVVVEVRDYRRSSNPSTYDYRHVLLKPSTQTILSDVALLTNDGQKWSQDERQAVEAALLLISSEPLCLDPSVSVAIAANSFHYHKQKLATVPLKRLAKKHSQPAINRKRRFEHCPAPAHLKLYDVLAKHKRKLRSQTLMSLKINKDNIDFWKQKDIYLEPPESVDVFKYAKEIEKTAPSKDNALVSIEEYKFEAERVNGKIQITNVTIYQRPSDEQYLGELTIRRENQETGSSCWYTLGHRSDVDKYISQCMEIFTEEGRKNVKITHIVPGKPAEITFTHGNTTTAAAASQ